MKLRRLPVYLRDTLLRLFPHRVPTGLRAIGSPGPDSPVLLTGNFALTVRRLEEALRGRDAWLLVANSRGINVWCAAGGGHLTHHDVITALRVSGIDRHVRHRRLVLPQLAATGVERRKVEEATGWVAVWGPARLEDLPEFLDRGGKVASRHRLMRFPLWERLEMAAMWVAPMGVVGCGVLWSLAGRAVAGAAVLSAACAVTGIFAFLPWLPVVGQRRWLTYAGGAAGGTGAGLALLGLAGMAGPAAVAWLAAAMTAAMLVLSIDLAGTTPWYPSSVNTRHGAPEVELLEARCTGAAQCVQVCPRGVLRMNGKRRKVEIAHPESCIRCGACIVQCPEDALRFRYADGRVVEPAVVRSTRLNLLGERTVRVAEP